jgi:hypothetical protein
VQPVPVDHPCFEPFPDEVPGGEAVELAEQLGVINLVECRFQVGVQDPLALCAMSIV